MSTFGAVAELLGSSDPGKKQFDHGVLKIRENTLVIGDAIYPIANVSTINILERKGVPLVVWIYLGLGALVFLSPWLRIAAFGFWFLALVAFVRYMITRPSTQYLLAIQMNGGNVANVASDNEEFLKAIALELYEVIELEIASNTTFNIDQRVRIDAITGSTVGITGIRGDIVNNVQAA
jgi:hypothetical protein